MEQRDVLEMVKEATDLSNEIEAILDGEDIMIILMALTKVSGVILAEAKGMSPLLVDERTSIGWFRDGVIAAYRAHLNIITPTDGKVH